MTTGSLSDYARHIGASPAYVTKLKQQGRLVMREVAGRVVVDFLLSDRLVRNTTDLGRAGNGRNASPDGESSGPVAPTVDGTNVDSVFRQAQAQERVFDAKRAELLYRKESGELIAVEAVRSWLAGVLSTTRESLLQVPGRMAAVLAAESNAGRVHELLDAELTQCLSALTAAADRVEVRK